MLNMQDIGYFLYMQEMEEKEKDEALKVNVKNNTDFVGEQAPSNEEKEQRKIFF